MQKDIPEWKRQSIVLKEQEKIRESLRKKVGDKFKNKFNETKFAKDIYKSDSCVIRGILLSVFQKKYFS